MEENLVFFPLKGSHFVFRPQEFWCSSATACYSFNAQYYFNREDVQKTFHANAGGLLPGKYQVYRWISQQLFSWFLHYNFL